MITSITEKIESQVLYKKFEEFLAQSPFKGLSPMCQQFIGMYGAFMGGYLLSQEDFKEQLKKFNDYH